MTGRHAGQAGSPLLSLRWLAGLFGILGIVLAVLGILALLGWGIYRMAGNPAAYLIFLVIIAILWAGKVILQWREARRFPWSTAGIGAWLVLAVLSVAAPSWPWVRPVAFVLAGLCVAYVIKLYSRRRRQRKAHA